MIPYSRLRLVEDYSCSAFIHPWSDGCLKGTLIMFASCMKGSLKLFLAAYGIKAFVKRCVDPQHSGGFMLQALLRSTIFGALTGTGFVVFNCALRDLLGKFTYNTLGFLPGVLTGFAIFIEDPSKRGLMSSTFIQMAVLLKMCEMNLLNPQRLTRKNTTHLFMVFNALMMLLMTTHSKTVAGHWIMNLNPKEFLTHDIKLLAKLILKDGAKYSAIGFGLTIFRAMTEFISSKRKVLPRKISSLLRYKFFGPALFMGVYVMASRAVNCLIAEYFGVDRRLAAFLSGYIAGATSWGIQPNLPLVSSAMASIALMVGDILRTKSTRFFVKYYGEILYIICCGIVFKARALRQETCPKIVKDVMSTATSKRSDIMATALRECISDKEMCMKIDF